MTASLNAGGTAIVGGAQIAADHHHQPWQASFTAVSLFAGQLRGFRVILGVARHFDDIAVTDRIWRVVAGRSSGSG
jgi:hypothetical protein